MSGPLSVNSSISRVTDIVDASGDADTSTLYLPRSLSRTERHGRAAANLPYGRHYAAPRPGLRTRLDNALSEIIPRGGGPIPGNRHNHSGARLTITPAAPQQPTYRAPELLSEWPTILPRS